MIRVGFVSQRVKYPSERRLSPLCLLLRTVWTSTDDILL